MSSYWDMLHLAWPFCTKHSASNCFLFRFSQSNVLKFWLKHALKAYKIKWFNHIIERKGILRCYFCPFCTLNQSKKWMTKNKTLMKTYWIINFSWNYTWFTEMYQTCVFHKKISRLMFRFWEILINKQLFRSI